MGRLSPLLFLVFHACIIYAAPGWHRDRDDDDETGLTSDTDVIQDTDVPTAPQPSTVDVRLHPSGAALGQTVIVSLVDHSDPPVDLSTVTDLDLLGPARVRVLALQTRASNEVLVTLRVSTGGVATWHDAIVTFEDGSSLMLQEAFLVVEDPADVPTDVWTGDPAPTETDASEAPADTDEGTSTVDSDEGPTGPATDDTDEEPSTVDTDGADTDAADSDDTIDTDADTDRAAADTGETAEDTSPAEDTDAP
jgi:hypothetical protein